MKTLWLRLWWTSLQMQSKMKSWTQTENRKTWNPLKEGKDWAGDASRRHVHYTSHEETNVNQGKGRARDAQVHTWAISICRCQHTAVVETELQSFSSNCRDRTKAPLCASNQYTFRKAILKGWVYYQFQTCCIRARKCLNVMFFGWKFVIDSYFAYILYDYICDIISCVKVAN